MMGDGQFGGPGVTDPEAAGGRQAGFHADHVRLSIQAGHGRLPEREDGEREDLLRGAAVDREPPAASPYFTAFCTGLGSFE
jgi:hypothetical protein